MSETPRIGAQRGRVVDDEALARVAQLLDGVPLRRDLLIEHLHRIQDACGRLSAAHLVALADLMRLAPAEVYEVATFYHHFDVVEGDDDAPVAPTVRVCNSITCALYGADALADELEAALGSKARVQRVSCVGRCDQAPAVSVGHAPVASAAIAKVDAVLAQRQFQSPVCTTHRQYARYRADGGYTVLRDCHEGRLIVDAVIDQLERSGLRGLGGAGFPAARKWRILRQQAGRPLVVVNIDEGEPGTFKDRHCLETDPHRMIEGALIAAWALGADGVYFYIRDEYPALRCMLVRELEALAADPPCELPPTLELRRGAGAYICGEESALVESIEGKRGMPRLRPPYLAEVGLFGRPTLEHNAETLHQVPGILADGPASFAQAGRGGRSGWLSFSVSGRVLRPGVYRAPAGISVRELVDEYAGGMQPGHELYAYFPGGASGGILPAGLADVPLDFDTLDQYGCFIGSAAIIVLSQHDRVRDAALNAMRFFRDESCGQCTPCRVGSAKAAALMAQPDWDRSLLEDLALVMREGSICGLGQAAPNPLLCAMKYFPEEFEIADG